MIFQSLSLHNVQFNTSICTGPQGWPWVWVRCWVSIQVEEDARISPLVERRASNTTRRRNSAATSDFQVETLRIRLGAIVALRTVQGDNLVTDHVISGFQVLGQGVGGNKIVLDQLIRHPRARTAGGDQTRLRDLGPTQVRRLLGCTFACLESVHEIFLRFRICTATRSNIVHNRTFVAFGPRAPYKIDLVTCVHRCVGFSGRCTLVASDVFRLKSARRHETDVLVVSIPACGDWPGADGIVEPHWVGTIREFAVDAKACYEPVSRRGIEKHGKNREEKGYRVHFQTI